MSYDLFYLGWREEDTEGTSKITGAGDTAYKIGSTTENTPLPDPQWDFVRVPPAWGERTTSSLVKTQASYATPSFAFLLNNAVPIYWALGKSSTAATVHTLTAQSQASGVVAELPTITLHAERIDSGGVLTDWQTQYTGLKNVAARFMVGDEYPCLTAVMSWMGMNASDPAFVLTTKPTNVTGTHTTPIHYLWPGSTHKYDSTTIQGITYWEIAITNGTFAVPGQYGSTSPAAIYQGGHQEITLTVRYRPQVDTLHDDLLTSTVPAKDWEFEFVRHATNDKLKFTCTTAATIKHPVPMGADAGDFVVELEALVTSLTVMATDQINQSFYGE